jgi:hypothetical protein
MGTKKSDELLVPKIINFRKENIMTDYHFLCLTNADLNLSSPTIQGVVYCPGLVCTHCQMSLTYGIILNIDGQLELWGTTCAAKYDPRAWVDGINPWRHFLHKYEIETCKICTPRQQEDLRALALYTQIYPDEVVGKSIYRQFLKNGELDDDQVFHMRSILFGKGWINALVSRRDLLCRLKILTLLKDKLLMFHKIMSEGVTSK